ncbi:MAG: two-component regulator propeller domain-containing protein, partial [Calditrichaceae bacterium]
MTVINIWQMSRSIFFFILFPVFVFAQLDDLQFDYFSVEDGLASYYTYCITQDSSGFIWIGTANGLNRYDGYNFTVFKHIPFDTTGLSDNLINALCFDQSGYLWIGTGNGGLNRYDPKTESFLCFKPAPTDPGSLSSDNVLALYQDRNKNLWIGTWRGGLNQLIFQSDSINLTNPIIKHFYHQPGNYNSIAGNTIQTIFEDSQGNLWIGTTNGLSKLSITDAKTIQITNYRHEAHDPFSLSHNNVTRICEDLNGTIWIGTFRGGVNKFNSMNDNFYHFTHDPKNHNSLSDDCISAIQTDRNDENILWIGTLYGGLNRLDINTGRIKRYEAIEQFYLYLKNYIYNLFQDASGLMWVAGYGAGIFKFNPQQNKFTKYQPGLREGKEEIIWGIYVNPNSNGQIVWLTSAGGGLLKFNRIENKFERYLSDLNHPDYKVRNLLQCLYGEPKKNNPSQVILWMGSSCHGVIQFDSETEKFKYYVDDQSHVLSHIRN